VSFPILSDKGHRVIDAYGIRDPDYNGQKFEGIPHPSVYVIDKDGRVAWAKVETDYKERPNSQDVRAALKKLGMVND
jgi:peroxiredoxin